MRTIKFRFWSGLKMFYDLENVMECLKQQLAFDDKLNIKTTEIYTHVSTNLLNRVQLPI